MLECVFTAISNGTQRRRLEMPQSTEFLSKTPQQRSRMNTLTYFISSDTTERIPGTKTATSRWHPTPKIASSSTASRGQKEPSLTVYSPESSALAWPLAPKESGMKDTSRNKGRPQMIRRSVRGLGQRSEKAMADLRRRATSDSTPINTSDIPEQHPADGSWVRGGHLVGGIRGAIIGEMQRQGLTRYQLWKNAKVLCPKLPSSAVYEYLDGRRQAGGTYIEAMLNALGLEIKPKATA
jgi:hypothetical protein